MSKEEWKAEWKIIRELGHGGQGTTYQVETVSEPRRVGVLKLLQKDNDPKARARMAKEAINLTALAKEGVKVPHVLAHNTQKFEEESVQMFLVMEFVGGQTLDEIVKTQGGKLPLEKSVAIASDLCTTMGSMHTQGVLHRDIKPANLMVRGFEKADLVVLDLGLSFDFENEQDTLTDTGETIKNELLALPEAVTPAGDRRDQRSDITNIVGVLFFCLTGQRLAYLRDQRNLAPHQRGAFGMQQVLAGDSRWRQVDLLFDVGFAADIEDRFQSIKELQNRLALVLETQKKSRNPLELDQQIGSKLKMRHRSLQIEDYRPGAMKVISAIGACVSELSGQMKSFSVSIFSPHMVQPPGFPSEIDVVSNPHLAIRVDMKTSTTSKCLYLVVGAKRDQCALLAGKSEIRLNHNHVPPNQWDVFTWFDPAKPPERGTIKEWVNDFVCNLIEELEKDHDI